MRPTRRVPRPIFYLASLALVLVVTGYGARPASAQVLYGSVVGTLTDETGATIPKAAIAIVNTATGLSRQTTANDAGYYSIPNLPEGVYDVSVTATGFRPYTQKGVNVSINSVTRVDAVIKLGALTEEVSVEASTAALQTTKSDVSVNLDTRAMENLPLSGYRNFQTLINLVPGATPGRFSERGHRYARARAIGQCERPGARRQQHPTGRFGRRPRHHASPRGVRAAG